MKLLGWLFIIILSAQILSILALELSSTTRDTKPHMQEQAIDGENGTTSFHGGSELKSGHSAKGSYGGANVVHRPPRSERSAAPPLLKSSPFFMFSISTTMLCAGFSLVLDFFPF